MGMADGGAVKKLTIQKPFSSLDPKEVYHRFSSSTTDGKQGETVSALRRAKQGTARTRRLILLIPCMNCPKPQTYRQSRQQIRQPWTSNLYQRELEGNIQIENRLNSDLPSTDTTKESCGNPARLCKGAREVWCARTHSAWA